MATNFNNRALAVSQKIYERLLRAYPPAHREAYGPAMAQLFRDECRDEWTEARGWGLTKLWLRVLPDLVSTSIRERLAALNERKTMNDKLTSLTYDRTTPSAIFIRVFLAVFLITVIAATSITYILPESYASTARIKVEQEAVLRDGISAYDPYFLQTTFEVLQSQIVLDPVIAKLNLNAVWGKKYNNGETLKSAESLNLLKNRISLAPIRGTKLISITVYSDDKNEAAQIANAIAESYRDYRVQSRAELVAKGIDAMQQEYQKQAAQIQLVQSDLDSLRQQFKIASDAAVSLSPQEQPYWDKKRDLSQLLEFHKVFYAKIEAEKLDMHLPKTSPVQITDTAEPGRAPVKPNKTLNIFIGAAVGGFLGLVAAGISVLIAVQFTKRMEMPLSGRTDQTGASSMTVNTNLKAWIKRFAIVFYAVATAMILSGIALNFSGSVHVGTPLIVMGLAVAGSTAIGLGHLKRW